MAKRACLPGEFFLDAAIINPSQQIERGTPVNHQHREDWSQPQPFDDETINRAKITQSFISLRWVLNPSLGIPLEPFTVWRRPVASRETAQPIPNWRKADDTLYLWDSVTEMMRIELDVTGAAVTALGMTTKGEPLSMASSTGGNATIVLEGGPILAVRLSRSTNVIAARGLSAVTMSNGANWRMIERVGLPITASPDLYYNPDGQGPQNAPTNAFDAAFERLRKWGPTIGWTPLSGLAPWQPPDPKMLIAEMEQSLLQSLLEVMIKQPPPFLDMQVKEEITAKLKRLRQVNGPVKDLNGSAGSPGEKSEARVRPLSALASAVATDAWSSLALGFGTGAELGDFRRAAADDFMVSAPWHGRMRMKLPSQSPFPFFGFSEPEEVMVEAKRELAAIVLSPKTRQWPAAPDPLDARSAFLEGAPIIDKPYHVATTITTNRPKLLPDRPRASAYALARFDAPAKGSYRMRKHEKAGGWYPVAGALPMPVPLVESDPAVPLDKVILRDSAILLPVTGPATQVQYAAATVDLFGQWSPWSNAWLDLDPAKVVSPGIVSFRAAARAGPGNADPCLVDVTLELIWEWRERSCASIDIIIDVSNPIAPPAQIPPPPPIPTPGLAAGSWTITFDAAGAPSTLNSNTEVFALGDEQNILPGAHATGTTIRRFRMVIKDIAVAFGSAPEKGAVAYARAIEQIRPTEQSDWTSSLEMAIAPSPLAPPTPVPLQADYPNWASLPNPSGISAAPVTWQPSGAPAYRLYLATEAALLAACGLPGPVLTKGYGERMQALFDLYKDRANWNQLRNTYRKVDEQSLLPPVHNGLMRHEVVLPRGSNLIHCFIIVGVTPANIVSSWPEPDADGRKGFIPFAIPRPVKTARPEIKVILNDQGQPEVAVRIDGKVAARTIQLFRTNDGRLARATGTMALVANVITQPGQQQTTVILDAGAPPSWQRLHYRAVALTDDNRDRAQMALPSLPSGSFAILRPPSDAPKLKLEADLGSSTQSASVVKINTNAPRLETDIGDHVLTVIAEQVGGEVRRFKTALSMPATFSTIAAFKASDPLSPVSAGYVEGASGPELYARILRAPGSDLNITADLTDPLSRVTRFRLMVSPKPVDVKPVIQSLFVQRLADRITARLVTNAPISTEPTASWTLSVTVRPTGPLAFGLGQTRTFDPSKLPIIASPAELPDPRTAPDGFSVGRIKSTGEILFWLTALSPAQFKVKLTNSIGEASSITRSSK
jgi:hypothetical protein